MLISRVLKDTSDDAMPPLAHQIKDRTQTSARKVITARLELVNRINARQELSPTKLVAKYIFLPRSYLF